jgi:SAM-dependent methyltransferase
MNISNTGYWILDSVGMDREHAFDLGVCMEIVALAKRTDKIIDLGCGKCDYTNKLLDLGFDIVGIDGNPITPQYCSRSDKIRVCDLTSDIVYETSYDLVLCLEVAEHVPAQYEDSLIRNIDRAVNPGGTLLLSWGVEGQPGYGHVNCRNNDYVKNVFTKFGYTSNEAIENNIREKASLPWFKNTIMVFSKHT